MYFIDTNHCQAFLSMLLKDIRSERPKITEKDNLRLLYVTKWFLEFFLVMQGKEQEQQKNGEGKWSFGLIAEVTERSWIIWVLKRMREAVEEKVRLSWGEYFRFLCNSPRLPGLIDWLMIDDLA